MNRLVTLPILLLAVACGGSSAGTGSGAAVVAVDRVDFGRAGVGETVSTRLAVEARGGQVTLLGAEVEGPFAVPIGEPVELAVGRPATIEVRFTPAAVGPAAGAVRLATSSGDVALPLAGDGVPPDLVCAPGAIDFGEVRFGDVAEETVRCENRSAVAWTMRAGTPGGDDPRGFDSPDAGAERELQAGGRLEARVRFAGRAGRAEAVLPILTRGGRVAAEVPLVARGSGTAIEAVPSAACPAAHDVGWIPPGGTRSSPIVLRNRAAGPVRVTGVEVTGAGFAVPEPVPFEVPADDPATAADEGRRTLTVEFSPEGEGAAAATLTLQLDDPALPAAVLCLRGFGGGPVLDCAPSALDLGPVAAGLPRTGTVTCRNVGTALPPEYPAELLVTATISGDGFSVAPDREVALAPGEEVALAVTFEPVATGVADGELEVRSNGPTSPPRTIALRADGLVAAPCVVDVPASLDLGDVLLGTELVLPVAIRNAGGDRCLVSDVALEGVSDPDAVAFPGPTPLARILEPQETLRVPLRFRVDSPATRTGRLAFTVSDPASPRRAVELRARGLEEPACLYVVPRSIDLGAVAPGCTSLPAEVRVWNLCASPVAFTGVELLGDAGLRFRAEAPTASVVPANGSAPVTFSLEAAPGAGAAVEAALRLRDAEGPVSHLVPVRAEVGVPTGVDVFGVRDAIDVLWVSDSEGGGRAPQHLVGNNAGTYLATALERAEVDFHLGVTTSGLLPDPTACGGEDGRLVPVDNVRPRILSRETPDLRQVFGANLLTGGCDSHERPLEAMLRALSPPVSTSADDPRHPQPDDGNLGFRRSRARLAVTFLMDEDDQSPRPALHYLDLVRWRVETSGREGLVTFHAIAGDEGTGCFSALAANRLIALVRQTGGHFMSICSFTWHDDLGLLGLATFGRTRFPLAARPADVNGDGEITFAGGDLQVLQDGRPLTMTGTPWTWNEAENAVDFALAWMPDPASPVEIRYTPACVGPESP